MFFLRLCSEFCFRVMFISLMQLLLFLLLSNKLCVALPELRMKI